MLGAGASVPCGTEIYHYAETNNPWGQVRGVCLRVWRCEGVGADATQPSRFRVDSAQTLRAHCIYAGDGEGAGAALRRRSPASAVLCGAQQLSNSAGNCPRWRQVFFEPDLLVFQCSMTFQIW